eukprot:jgi/Chrzof1/11363/Cz05g34030.t1
MHSQLGDSKLWFQFSCHICLLPPCSLTRLRFLSSFFPATLYLSTSKLAVAAVGNLTFAAALCMYNIIIKVFLGNLREIELERVKEKLSSAIMETCLALTIFREEFNMAFVAMFTILTFVKVFHWLVQDRVDYIEVTPTVSRVQHLRIMSFMCALLAIDVMFLQQTVAATLAASGHSVQLLFAFEYVILSSSIVATFGKYALSMADAALEGRWEGKGLFVFYLELLTDMLHLFVYCIFFVIVFTHYGLPLHLIRDLYLTFRNFRNRIADFLRFRQVTARMDRFPDATPEDLARCDGICIICREEMQATGLNKKLHCGHVFHLHCLRSWLERQQNCPTCRTSVFRPPQAPEAAARPEGPPAAAVAEGEPAAAAAAAGQQGGSQAVAGQQGAGQRDQAAAAGRPAGAGTGLRMQRGGNNSIRRQGSVGVGVAGGQAARTTGRLHAHSNRGSGQSAGRGGGAAGASSSNRQAGAPQQAVNLGPMSPTAFWPTAAPMPAGVVWQMPQWYPVTSMAAFSNTSMQYAGQQTAESSFEQQAIAGMVPLLPVIPAISAPFPAMLPPLAPNASPEQQHHAAAAAAAMAAAAAAMYATPMAGLAMMPPAMLQPPPSGASANISQEQVAAAAAANVAAVAAAALMGGARSSDVVQGAMEATQHLLQRQLEYVQSQVDRMRNQGNNAGVNNVGVSNADRPGMQSMQHSVATNGSANNTTAAAAASSSNSSQTPGCSTSGSLTGIAGCSSSDAATATAADGSMDSGGSGSALAGNGSAESSAAAGADVNAQPHAEQSNASASSSVSSAAAEVRGANTELVNSAAHDNDAGPSQASFEKTPLSAEDQQRR